MQRSRVNAILRDARTMIEAAGFRLPPFGDLDPDALRALTVTAPQIVTRRLGWDITDYGQGDFDRLGLTLFTLRNGDLADLQRGGGMCYAEKLLISRRDQLSPMHTHVLKVEDIINRAGATLAVQLYGSDAMGGFDPEAGGVVLRDGVETRYAPGDVLALKPGQSVTLRPGDWHAFWGDGGDVLIGEVSTVNDDLHDNIFVDPIGRFAQVIDDAPPLHLLVSDYDSYLG